MIDFCRFISTPALAAGAPREWKGANRSLLLKGQAAPDTCLEVIDSDRSLPRLVRDLAESGGDPAARDVALDREMGHSPELLPADSGTVP